jgi:hypothetical protein
VGQGTSLIMERPMRSLTELQGSMLSILQIISAPHPLVTLFSCGGRVPCNDQTSTKTYPWVWPGQRPV